MTRDLGLRNFWTFPAVRWFDWDDEDLIPDSTPSGLSISENEKNVFVEAHVPGLNPEDVEITFDKGVLWIKGERREEEEDKKKKFYRVANRSFSYRVAVPGEIDPSKEPDAECKNGVMKITFFKHPASLPKKIKVKALK